MRHSSFQLYLETVSVKKQTLCAITCFANPDAFTETTFRTASHRPTSAGNQNHQMPDSTSLRHEEKRKERWLFIRDTLGQNYSLSCDQLLLQARHFIPIKENKPNKYFVNAHIIRQYPFTDHKAASLRGSVNRESDDNIWQQKTSTTSNHFSAAVPSIRIM